MNKYPQHVEGPIKKWLEGLITSASSFLSLKISYHRTETKNKININVFEYENEQMYPIYFSENKFKDKLELLLLKNNENPHYVYIRDFNKFIYDKTRNEKKKFLYELLTML